MTAPAIAFFQGAVQQQQPSTPPRVHYQAESTTGKVRGWLLKRDEENTRWNKFFFELRNTLLIQYEDDGQPIINSNNDNTNSPAHVHHNPANTHSFELRGAIISQVGQDPFSNVFTWTLSTTTTMPTTDLSSVMLQTLNLGTVHEDDRKRWLHALEKAIKRATTSIQPTTPLTTPTVSMLITSTPTPPPPANQTTPPPPPNHTTTKKSTQQQQSTSISIKCTNLDVKKQILFRGDVERMKFQQDEDDHPNWMLSPRKWKEIKSFNSCRFYTCNSNSSSNSSTAVVGTTLISRSSQFVAEIAYDILQSHQNWDPTIQKVDLLSINEIGIVVRIYEKTILPGQELLGLQNCFELTRSVWMENDGTYYILSKGVNYLSCFKIIPLSVDCCFVFYFVDCGSNNGEFKLFLYPWLLKRNMDRVMAIAGIREYCVEL
jgi:hypothetical protein